MPKTTLTIAPVASQEIQTALAWIRRRSKSGANRWYRALKQAILRIRREPFQHAVAPEAETIGIELRHSIFSTPVGQPYRLLFTIDGNHVTILFFRGTGQDLVQPDDVI